MFPAVMRVVVVVDSCEDAGLFALWDIGPGVVTSGCCGHGRWRWTDIAVAVVGAVVVIRRVTRRRVVFYYYLCMSIPTGPDGYRARMATARKRSGFDDGTLTPDHGSSCTGVTNNGRHFFPFLFVIVHVYNTSWYTIVSLRPVIGIDEFPPASCC